MTEMMYLFKTPRQCHQYYIEPSKVQKFVENKLGHKAFTIQSILAEFENDKETLIIKYTLNKIQTDLTDIEIRISLKQFDRIDKFENILND